MGCQARYRTLRDHSRSDAIVYGLAAVSATDIWAFGSEASGMTFATAPMAQHWDGTSWTEEDTARLFNRTENVRVIPPSDPYFARLYARRNDAESINL